MDLDGWGHHVGRWWNAGFVGHGDGGLDGLFGRHGLGRLGGLGGRLAAFFLLLLQGVQGSQEGTLEAGPLRGDAVEEGEALVNFEGGFVDHVLVLAGAHEKPLGLGHLFE